MRITDKTPLLTYEKAIQTLADTTVFANQALTENIGKLWLVRELELMGGEAFIKALSEASESGSAAVIYLARLVIDTRIWESNEERARVRMALTKAEDELNLPQGTQSLEILQECQELIWDIESAHKALATGTEDLRSKVRPYTEIRKIREAVKAAEEQERKSQERQLEAMEENLILQGHV